LNPHRQVIGDSHATGPYETPARSEPCLFPGPPFPLARAIAENPNWVLDYTNKGNLVAVILTGRRFGVVNRFGWPSKPVMEGQIGVCSKRFAERRTPHRMNWNTRRPGAFINAVKLMGRQFGGINLEVSRRLSVSSSNRPERRDGQAPSFMMTNTERRGVCAAGLLKRLAHFGAKDREGRASIVLNGRRRGGDRLS